MPLKRVRCLIGFLVLISILSLLRIRTVGADEGKQIDLSATTKYVNAWAARESFPDSPIFAYENAFCELALSGRVEDPHKKRIIEFLKNSQNVDGGFVSAPELKENSNVILTYFALAALDLIDATSAVRREKAADFVMSLVQDNGGITATAGDKVSNLGTTYYGIRCLYVLKALDRIDKAKTIAYIESYREADKGFGVIPGKPSAPQSTFMAVESLRLLGGLAEDIKPGVIRYLKETPYSGSQESKNRALMNMENTAYVLETASILSAIQQLDVEEIHHFVESLYIPENGGFGPSPGYGTTPPGTYYAVWSLGRLGRLEGPLNIR